VSLGSFAAFEEPKRTLLEDASEGAMPEAGHGRDDRDSAVLARPSLWSAGPPSRQACAPSDSDERTTILRGQKPISNDKRRPPQLTDAWSVAASRQDSRFGVGALHVFGNHAVAFASTLQKATPVREFESGRDAGGYSQRLAIRRPHQKFAYGSCRAYGQEIPASAESRRSQHSPGP
jgi:hypothetical protein